FNASSVGAFTFTCCGSVSGAESGIEGSVGSDGSSAALGEPSSAAFDGGLSDGGWPDGVRLTTEAYCPTKYMTTTAIKTPRIKQPAARASNRPVFCPCGCPWGGRE